MPDESLEERDMRIAVSLAQERISVLKSGQDEIKLAVRKVDDRIDALERTVLAALGTSCLTFIGIIIDLLVALKKGT